MRIYTKAEDKKKPTKPKVSRGTRKPAQPLDPTQQQLSGHVAETIIAVQAAVNTPEVQAALATGNINTATDSFPWEVFDQKLSALAGPLEELVRRSLIIPHLMPKKVVIQTNFNHLDPRVAHSARTMSSKLATSMSAEQYGKVRTIIGNGVAKGDTVKQISQVLRSHIGLNARQDRQMTTAVLDATQEAIDAGLTGESITAYVADTTDSLYTRLVNYRADLIARTETMAAQNTGFMLGVQQGVEDPNSSIDTTWLKRWIATDDERTCPICGVLDGQEIPLDENFVTEDGDEIGYPLEDGSTPHPQCRCTVGLVPPNRDVAGLASGDAVDAADAEIDPQMTMDFTAALRPSRSVIDMALAMFNKTYNPDQPRNDHGEWSSEGASDKEIEVRGRITNTKSETGEGPWGSTVRDSSCTYTTPNGEQLKIECHAQLKADEGHIKGSQYMRLSATNAAGKSVGDMTVQENLKSWQPTGKGLIQSLGVNNDYQRQGIATALLSFAREQSLGMTVEHYGLSTDGKAFASVVKAYDPSEARDEHGKWTSGGAVPTSLSTTADGKQTIKYGDITIERDKPGARRSPSDQTRFMWTFTAGNDAMRTVSANVMGISNPSTSLQLDEATKQSLLQGIETINPNPSETGSQAQFANGNYTRQYIGGAYTLLQDVNDHGSVGETMYRGIIVPSDSSLLDVKPGDPFTIPLSSTCNDLGVAERYSWRFGTPEGRAQNQSVVLQFDDSTNATAIRHQAKDDGGRITEYVTQGKFEVSSVSQGTDVKGDNYTLVKLAQKEVFNPEGGGYEPVKH